MSITTLCMDLCLAWTSTNQHPSMFCTDDCPTGCIRLPSSLLSRCLFLTLVIRIWANQIFHLLVCFTSSILLSLSRTSQAISRNFTQPTAPISWLQLHLLILRTYASAKNGYFYTAQVFLSFSWSWRGVCRDRWSVFSFSSPAVRCSSGRRP